MQQQDQLPGHSVPGLNPAPMVIYKELVTECGMDGTHLQSALASRPFQVRDSLRVAVAPSGSEGE